MSNTISSFNGGLFSSYLRGRPELEKYHNALQDCSNYHLLPYGALQNRAGTYFISDEQTTDMRLIPFQYNISQSYAIVLFNNKIKIIYNDFVIGSGGVPGGFSGGFSTGFSVDFSEYSIVSPWTNEQLFEIQYVQIADTMYMVHPEVAPQTLVRNADDDWTLTAIDYSTGPFLPYNITGTTITPSATTGTGITLTASASLFVVGDIGRTIELKQIRTDSTTTATSTAYSPWIKVKGNWDFSTRGTWTGTVRIYRRINGGTQAEFRSFNASADNNFLTDGEELEDGVEMRIFGRTSCTATLTVDDFFVYGVAEVTAFTSDTIVTADILVDCDAATATVDWAYNAFSTATGYPTAIALYNERMCIGGTLQQPNTVFLSKIDQWGNYQSSNNALDALSFKLNTSETIRWMEEQGELIIGTSGNEYKLGPQTSDDVLGGDNVKASREGAEGSSNIQSVTVGDILVFITRDSKRAKTIGYNFEADKLKARDLNSLSGNELMESGVRQVVYKQNPYSEIYFVLNDGSVAIMTFDQDQNIFGWTTFEAAKNKDGVAGLYKSATVLKGVDDDTVYFAVERTLRDITTIFIEKMADRDFESQTDWFFVDNGLTGTFDPAQSTVSGLGHLDGETVSVIADGGLHPDRVVVGGSITLDDNYSKVHVGLGYRSIARPMSLDSSDGSNSTMGQRKKQNRLKIKLKDSVSIKAGQYLDKLETLRVNKTSDIFGEIIKPESGTVDLIIRGTHEEEFSPYFIQDIPQAQEILGYIAPVSTGG